MANVEIHNNIIRVTEAMEQAVIAGLEEAGGEVQARAKRNSRQGHSYGNVLATALWDYNVDEANFEAQVGSPYEAGYWEEFGTGEHALNGGGRQGWWVYIEGQESGSGGKSYATQAEAEEAARFLRRVAKLDAYATNGLEPNRPLHRAFESSRSVVEAIIQSRLRGMG